MNTTPNDLLMKKIIKKEGTHFMKPLIKTPPDMALSHILFEGLTKALAISITPSTTPYQMITNNLRL